MRWMKYSVETIPEAVWAVSDLLYDLGITSIEVEDHRPVLESIDKEGGYYEELQPDLGEDDGTARVIFYLEEGLDSNDILIDKLIHGLDSLTNRMEIGSGMLAVSISDEADWRDNWKEFFHPFTIGKLLVKPTWESVPNDWDPQYVIDIDPGISFGTGQHETTRMCIEELQQHINEGDAVLDLGFGSGILSIAAAKLGAGSITGTDIDEDCRDTAVTNFEKNGYPGDRARLLIGDLRNDDALAKEVGQGCYDIVLANILADIIIGMTDRIHAALSPGGMLIASGIIDFKENEVLDKLTDRGFTIIETNHLGEWSQISAKKDIY